MVIEVVIGRCTIGKLAVHVGLGYKVHALQASQSNRRTQDFNCYVLRARGRFVTGSVQDQPIGYLPHLDGLRAIAILAVLAYHFDNSLLPGGFAGVDLFFVLSGFIVSASIGHAQNKGLLSFALYFYARRFIRIAPALIVCMLATTLATAIFLPSLWPLSDANSRTGLLALVGFSNVELVRAGRDYFSPLAEFNPYTHTWSLGVEEQFYLLFPFLFFMWTYSRFRSLSIAGFAVGLLISIVWSAFLVASDGNSAFYLTQSRLWELAVGVLVYQGMASVGCFSGCSRRPLSPIYVAAGTVASAGAVALGFVAGGLSTVPLPGSLPVVAGTAGLLYLLHDQSPRAMAVRILANPALRFLGRVSYSLYLWHWPVLVLFRWTVGLERPQLQLAALALIAALTLASYYLVEQPIRRMRLVQLAPRYAVVLSGLCAIALSWQVAKKINAQQPNLSISTLTRNAPDWYYGVGPSTSPSAPGCELRAVREPIGEGEVFTLTRTSCPVAAKPLLFVIGDLHAQAFRALLHRYALDSGASVVLYNLPGCSLVSLQHAHGYSLGLQRPREYTLQPSSEYTDRCRAMTKLMVADLAGRLKPGDIVFLASLRMPRLVSNWTTPLFPFPEKLVTDLHFSERAAKERESAVDAAAGLIAKLETKGARVILNAPTPVFRAPAFRCAESYNRSNPICRHGLTISKDEIERLRKPVLDAIGRLAARAPRTVIWDPLPVLCPGADCSALRDGRPLFFDGDHLSGYGNMVLLPAFRAVVDRLIDEG